MREVHSADGLQVYDDVLSTDAFQRLRQWSQTVGYVGVHHQGWRTVWRHGEGEPLRGPNWVVPVDPLALAASDVPAPAPLDPLVAVLRQLVLTRPRRPREITLTPWIYPRDTALGLHLDDDPYDGSYIYYTVPEWDVHWGGLLHGLAERPDRPVVPRAVLDLSAERASVAEVGRGSWVSPAPNRLVLVAARLRHFISRVDPNAGDRPRTSIAGFFRRG